MQIMKPLSSVYLAKDFDTKGSNPVPKVGTKTFSKFKIFFRVKVKKRRNNTREQVGVQ